MDFQKKIKQQKKTQERKMESQMTMLFHNGSNEDASGVQLGTKTLSRYELKALFKNCKDANTLDIDI